MLPTPQSRAAAALPKRFMLMPDKETLQVVYAAQCIGHVWSEQNKWRARTEEGRLLATGWQSILEAVTALFDERKEHVFPKTR